MNCWAESYCKWKTTKGCIETCSGYTWLNVLYSQSNIPLIYQYKKPLRVEPCDSDSYKHIQAINTDVINWVNEGNTLLLTGKTGTGKTTLACSIANSYIRYKVADCGLEAEVMFIKTFDFLDTLRKQFDNPDPSFDNYLLRIRNVNLLVIDDIGAEKSSNWAIEKLLSIIDYRLGERKATVFTSNLKISQLQDQLGPRIADRLNDCKILYFTGESKRGD